MRDRLGDKAKPTTIRFEYRTNIINLPQHDVEELDIVHVGRSHLAHQLDGDGHDGPLSHLAVEDDGLVVLVESGGAEQHRPVKQEPESQTYVNLYKDHLLHQRCSMFLYLGSCSLWWYISAFLTLVFSTSGFISTLLLQSQCF